MNKLLLLAGLISLLTTTGCIIADDRGHRHERHDDRGEVTVGPPIVVVPVVGIRHDRD